MVMSDTKNASPCGGEGKLSTAGGVSRKMRERPAGGGGGHGSELAASKRLERAERKRAQAAAEAAGDDEVSRLSYITALAWCAQRRAMQQTVREHC